MNQKPMKPICYVDMDSILADMLGRCFDNYVSSTGLARPDIADVNAWDWKFPNGDGLYTYFKEPGFFAGLDPIPGAVDGFRALSRIGYETCVEGAAYMATPDRRLAFLLHELDEVFLPDIPGPLKHMVSANVEPWSGRLSRLHKRACRKALGIPDGVAEEGEDTKEMDALMLGTERRDLMKHVESAEWARYERTVPGLFVTAWDWETAEGAFRVTFEKLKAKVLR